VTTEIVDDDDVAWFEVWDEYLFDIRREALAVDRTVEQAGASMPSVKNSDTGSSQQEIARR
jgi:hypothetical protein